MQLFERSEEGGRLIWLRREHVGLRAVQNVTDHAPRFPSESYHSFDTQNVRQEMRSVEVINRIAPNCFDRFRFNTSTKEMLSVLTTEHDLTEDEVSDAISKLDVLVQECYQALKVMVQAQMPVASTPEQKAESDLDLLIDRTMRGVEPQAKERIKGYAGWLIAKG